MMGTREGATKKRRFSSFIKHTVEKQMQSVSQAGLVGILDLLGSQYSLIASIKVSNQHHHEVAVTNGDFKNGQRTSLVALPAV